MLVVGDNSAVHSLVKSAVDDVMDVDVARTADDALTAVWDGEYDGVIVQQSLPDIGGVELLRLMRTGSRTAALPLMLVSEPDARTHPADSHVGGVDEVVALNAAPIEMMTRLRLLTQRSLHASASAARGDVVPLLRSISRPAPTEKPLRQIAASGRYRYSPSAEIVSRPTAPRADRADRVRVD